jgi:hypothetical protein
VARSESAAGVTRRGRAKASAAKETVKPRDICLLGYAEETRDLVFGLDESVEVWGINMAHAFVYGPGGLRTKAKPTYWFQLHPRDWSGAGKAPTGYFGRPKEHLDFLAKFDGTVWTQAVDPDIPNSRAYPAAEIAAASGRQYFTSTFAYQLGLAWHEHVVQERPIATVRVYGVNLTSLDEYIHQKSCVEYWLGRLEQAGVRVEVPRGSALLKGKLYAMDDADLSDHAFERLQHWKGKYTAAWANINTALSMKAELKFWASQLSSLAEAHPGMFTDEVKAQVQAIFDRRSSNLNTLSERGAAEMNGALGMVKDNQHWLAITGGIDHRAPQLPDLRLPADHLAQDWEVPEPRSI